MPTIKDIANEAGVSHGTVSNVLNGRGNVSAKKIKLVEDAASKLGYRLNLQAKMLKEGTAKTISVILPDITSQHYSNLYNGLFNFLHAKGYELTLYLTHDIKELELQFIQKIATKRDSAIITVSCLDSAESYYRAVKAPKDKIIFVYREPEFTEQFISLDYQQAGRDIADEIMKKGHYHIGLFINTDKNTYERIFEEGFIERFTQKNYPIEFCHNELVSTESTYNQAFSLFANNTKKTDAIITTDIERVNFIRNANYFGDLAPCPAIFTLSNDDFFLQDGIYHYRMNYGMLSQNIVDMIDGVQTTKIINPGFISLQSNVLQQSADKIVNILIIPSPSTDALRKLLPHFYKISGINVNLIVKPFDEIYHILNTLDQHQEIDIIRIDMAGLPWFATSSLKPLNDLNINLDNILKHFSNEVINRFSYVHDITYAIPFDPSVQLLFYRHDLFNDPLIKRLFYEKYHQNLQVPTTFVEFDKITSFFNHYFNRDSPILFGGCITLGNTEIIASEFLLRYYAQGGKLIDNETIQLNKTIAFNTLNKFSQFIQNAKPIEASWWLESVKLFEQGDLAMLIVYMNLFSYMGRKKILPLISYTSVPGNMPLFGGGSLSMSKYSNKNNEVSTFFNWLFSKEISEQIVLLGGSTVQDSTLQNQQVKNDYPWLNVIHNDNIVGVRENYLKNGQSINLRQIEDIIGQHIFVWLKGDYDTEQTITRINNELAKKNNELIK